MKLLRLISDEPTGLVAKSEFENYFKDNIIIPKQAQIGLLHASIPINYKEIHINSSSNQFQFKTAKGNTYKTVNLGDENMYSIDDFLNLFKSAIWKVLSFKNPSDIGFVIHLSKNTQNLFIISTWRLAANMKMYVDDMITLRRNIDYADDNDNIVRSDQTTSGTNAFLFSRLPQLLSCSYYRTTILSVGNFIFGLTNLVNGALIANLDDNSFNYAVKVDGGKYWYLNEAQQMVQVEDSENVLPRNGNIVSIEIDKGKICYRIYSDSAATIPDELYSFDIDQLETLHPAIGLRQTTVKVSRPELFYDPVFKFNSNSQITYQDVVENEIYEDAINEDAINIGLSAPPKPPSNLNKASFYINFTQEGLKNILGFNGKTIIKKGIATKTIATNPFNALSIPSTLLVELLNIKLNSYDGLTSTRRNIVAIIPNQVSSSSEKLLYSVPNPIMLDIDNLYEMNLNSIRARIMSGDDAGSLLEVNDRIELTFLIS